MRMRGSFKLLGVEARQGFKDPSQTFYVMGLGEGMDVLRVYIDAVQYGSYCKFELYSDVFAELEYNPVSQKNPFKLIEIDLIGGEKNGNGKIEKTA